MNKQQLNKYFRNQCSPEEIEQVLEWFQTEEGLAYFEASLERDMHRYADDERLMLYPDIPSDTLLLRIHQSKKSPHRLNHHSYWKIRAFVAVIIGCILAAHSLLYMQFANSAGNQPPEITYRTISTQADQHRLVTLADGTHVRLNSNSSIQVPDPFAPDRREVILSGEAWFDIAADTNRPFYLTAEQAHIRVLGTQFNVKIDTLSQYVQIAVAEGRVSLNQQADEDGRAAILTQETFAILDLDTHEMLIEQTPVENYLSWFKGRLYFYNDPLWVVSRYLERIYDVSFAFDTQQLRDLPLSVDLAKDDLTTVLDIIGQTLGLDYTLERDTVLWITQQPTITTKQQS
ncbi:MAG: DUF4974 domain-containing protein [Balneolaceae bacterium]|nr:MAG: DUF4974 domain-containing protein [Balneolaceae bacterium]